MRWAVSGPYGKLAPTVYPAPGFETGTFDAVSETGGASVPLSGVPALSLPASLVVPPTAEPVPFELPEPTPVVAPEDPEEPVEPLVPEADPEPAELPELTKPDPEPPDPEAADPELATPGPPDPELVTPAPVPPAPELPPDRESPPFVLEQPATSRAAPSAARRTVRGRRRSEGSAGTTSWSSVLIRICGSSGCRELRLARLLGRGGDFGIIARAPRIID